MRTTVVIAIGLVLTAFSAASEAANAALPQVGTLHQSGAGAQVGTPPKPAPQAAPVDINTATAKELEALPGVGPALAARIIEYRAKAGGFRKIEDLMSVRGIGEKAFLKLKPMIVVTRGKGQGW